MSSAHRLFLELFFPLLCYDFVSSMSHSHKMLNRSYMSMRCRQDFEVKNKTNKQKNPKLWREKKNEEQFFGSLVHNNTDNSIIVFRQLSGVIWSSSCWAPAEPKKSFGKDPWQERSPQSSRWRTCWPTFTHSCTVALSKSMLALSYFGRNVPVQEYM